MCPSRLLLPGLLLLTALFAEPNAPPNPQLKQVQSVYLLPMIGGLDQYLANHITSQGLFQVVTDPQKADAVFTDRIGEGFEDRLAELYPDLAKQAEKAAQEKKAAEEKKASGEKSEDKKTDDWSSSAPKARSTSFSRARGTLFLVDRKTHSVIWSIYSPSKSSQPRDLNRNADAIAKRLIFDVKGKQ